MNVYRREILIDGKQEAHCQQHPQGNHGFLTVSYTHLPRKVAKKLLPRIGSLIESPGFYPNLTATENLLIFATLRGVPNLSLIHILFPFPFFTSANASAIFVSCLVIRRVKKQIAEITDALADVKYGNGNRRILSATNELVAPLSLIHI